ncbi:carbon storage regulator CsrA [Paenibacillus thermotolerans]|uniref:carbon storage regulator CsrA n=1 Tax=Paenibacillus thermotolerans TaxID=3027807 RepID=UPI002367DFFE|nr:MULTISPECIES: carbon storage regulator CsrA [unclassified Paenibacillus]
MLVLARKKGESIMIGENIELVIIETEGDTVRVGIKAPKEVQVYRKEIYTSIQEANREASQGGLSAEALKDLFRKKE